MASTPARMGPAPKIDAPAPFGEGSVADAIVRRVAAGSYIEQAAASVGVHRVTVFSWLKRGAEIRSRVLSGEFRPSQVRGMDLLCVDFAAAMEQAEAQWFVEAEAQLSRAARGGQQVQTVTEKVDGRGRLIERVTKTETLPPDNRVTMWRLERKNPSRYGRRVLDVNLGGQPDGSPIQVDVVSVDDLLEGLDALLGEPPDAIDTTTAE